MDFITVLFIALGLSMDSLAVSVASGISIKFFKLKNVFKIAFFLAFFQGIMPLIGWSAGIGFKHYITPFDHWVAFGLLLFLGIKMIVDGYKNPDGENGCNPLKMAVLLGLSIATSIDALAVGISFAFLDISIITPILIIGITTFLVSLSGILIGIHFGKKFNLRIELIGGIILIGIGIKILLEHTLFA